ncbi:OadG-related small transporter subunit [Aerococcus sanguinicola]|nr:MULTISPECIES: OadG-related small transporter subunit [unclassified Aerococcus]MDK6234283.1 OadG-related small transporter subunit [Aerococcus sp. UMB10185]MDK6804405.1 OadG-related small transporter subunit [Aerococcus sp. UMB7834]MDK6855493.1 OadG-related small transporter subunit [Aerococcus sp. UMB7533]MDK8503286.1 OadG-related small transporter subunit [Aerococcus sp. UMB1112A]
MNENFVHAFQILLLGWGGIFVVMAFLYLAVKVLLKVFPPEDNK